jgi:hypothetical protein
MKLNIPEDCGNSPKKALVKELSILFASYRVDEVKKYLAGDIKWTLVGDKPIVGREVFAAELLKMSSNKAKELSIYSIITHGAEAAVHGEMKMQDGKAFGFSDFYEFTSAKASKVKAITSYVIELKRNYR